MLPSPPSGWHLVPVLSALALAGWLGACSSNQPSELTVERLMEIQDRHEDEILELPGVLGIGISQTEEGELHLAVLVDRSLPKPELPTEIEGAPVRSAPRNPIRLLNGPPACGITGPCHGDEQPLPVEMGNSGSWGVGTGADGCTLGFKACDLDTGKLVFVTNSHCNQSFSTCAVATPGGATSFWQHPGRRDVDVNPGQCIIAGTCTNIGDIAGSVAPSCDANNNKIDATKVTSAVTQTSNAFRDIGFAQAGPGSPFLGAVVRKSGRTTGETSGVVTGIHQTVTVSGEDQYCCGVLKMKDQIEWLPLTGESKGGDSGSALLSFGSEFQVVGLNWGSDETFSYANHIDNVLAGLNLSLNFFGCIDDECLFSTMADALGDSEQVLALGHRFRKQVLESTPRGQVYVNIYAQVSDEAVRIVAARPGLLARTAELFRDHRSIAERLARSEPVVITEEQIDRVDALLADYQRYGSESLKRALDILRQDLRDPDVLRQFRVSVTP